MKKMAFLPFILVLIFSAVSILPLILYMYLTFGWPILFYPGISEIFFSFRSKNTRILCTVEGHFVQTSVTFSSVYRYLLVLFVVARDGNLVFTFKYPPILVISVLTVSGRWLHRQPHVKPTPRTPHCLPPFPLSILIKKKNNLDVSCRM